MSGNDRTAEGERAALRQEHARTLDDLAAAHRLIATYEQRVHKVFRLCRETDDLLEGKVKAWDVITTLRGEEQES